MARRSGDATEAIYSEEDVARMRERWEQGERDRGFVTELGVLKGKLELLPGQMELIAKKVVLETMAEQKKERIEQGSRRWLRADQVSVILQLMVTAFVAYIAFRR